METGLITSTNTTSTSTTKVASKDLDKNAFLSLLVAQLKNQDPTASQDTNQMVQQMTSYSSLEQMQNMNKSLTGIQGQNVGIFEAQSSSLIGKQVQVTSSSMNLKDGAATVGVHVDGAANVTLTVKDASGKLVATLDQGSQTAGDHIVNWNGKDASGNKVADGTYAVSVTAKAADGSAVNATTSSYARVDSVSFINGTVMVIAGGKSFPISDITQISA